METGQIAAQAPATFQIEERSGSTTIEMKTDEMKDAVNDAIGKGKEPIDKAGQEIKQLGDSK